MTAPAETPRTDALGTAISLAWFGLNDTLARVLDESGKYRELARTLERELASARAMERWQPIETAPKDGTRIILHWNGKVIVGFYLDNSASSYPWQGFRSFSGEPFLPGQPTHWRALPEPPAFHRVACSQGRICEGPDIIA